MIPPSYHVRRAVAHVEVAKPILRLSLFITAFLGALAIGGGIVAIVWNTVSPTQISMLGMKVTTGHVGVALAALGIIALIAGVRSVNRNIYKLAALPPERLRRR